MTYGEIKSSVPTIITAIVCGGETISPTNNDEVFHLYQQNVKADLALSSLVSSFTVSVENCGVETISAFSDLAMTNSYSIDTSVMGSKSTFYV